MNESEKQLVTVASEVFKLEVERLLPIGESFASEVIRFQHAGQAYVLKCPFSVEKAKREFHWLTKMAHLGFVPKPLGLEIVSDRGYVLMSALTGLPLQGFQNVTEQELIRIGRDMKRMHGIGADDFDGFSHWHDVLLNNVERYMSVLKAASGSMIDKAYKQFRSDLAEIPNKAPPTATHFDLRAGNILGEQGGYTGIIDFESMRGGHPSMDFFKLVMGPADLTPAQLNDLLVGYGSAEWFSTAEELIDLVSRYRIYHGLAGLAWCVSRGLKPDTEFYQRSLGFVDRGLTEHRL